MLVIYGFFKPRREPGRPVLARVSVGGSTCTRGERFWIVVGYNTAFCCGCCYMGSESDCAGAAGRDTLAIQCCALAHLVAYVEYRLSEDLATPQGSSWKSRQ